MVAQNIIFLSYVYWLLFSALELLIIIDIEVGEPGHGKYAVAGKNAIDKQMPNLATEKVLNNLLIPDGPNFNKFMQVYKSKEDQDVTLATEYWSVLHLIHTRDTNNNKLQ